MHYYEASDSVHCFQSYLSVAYNITFYKAFRYILSYCHIAAMSEVCL